MEKNHYNGVLPDPNPEAVKEGYLKHEEIFGGLATVTPFQWEEEPIYFQAGCKWPQYPMQNQNTTSQCVRYSTEHALAIQRVVLEGKPFVFNSPDYGYRLRSNYPSPGMFYADNARIETTIGTCSLSLCPQATTEDASNALVITPAMQKDALTRKVDAFFFLTNIDDMAWAIKTFGAIITSVGSNYAEYNDHTNPKADIPLYNGQVVTFGHSLAGKYAHLYQGVKSIIIDDSCHEATDVWGGQRLFTEDFLSKRMSGAGYFLQLEYKPIPLASPFKPFTVPLMKGTMSNEDVVQLQNILKVEGLFPSNVPSSGNYLEITRQAVLSWQMKYNVDTPEALDSNNGVEFGQKSILVANALYQPEQQ
jgi:hypothetical protein